MLDRMPGHAFHAQSFHSDLLSANSAEVQYPINFHPSYWMVVARLTVGHILVYVGPNRASLSFKLDRGTLTLPIDTQTLAIETVGATGFYDVYAIHELTNLDIKA